MNKFMLSLFTVSVLLITALILSCYVEHDDAPQVCSGVEYDPDVFACIRGELVPLDDGGNSSPSGNRSSSSGGTGGGNSSSSGNRSSSSGGNNAGDGNWYTKDTSAVEFIIYTADELAEFSKLTNNGNKFTDKTVKLGANIMLNDTTNWEDWARTAPANTWTPIGDFRGTFDGNGYVVSGVYINNLNDHQGLFKILGGGGEIKNLGVIAFYIKGKNNIGGLVGENGRGAKIENSYSIGRVSGENSVGGLVGDNSDALISNCFHSGITRGVGENVGGLVGNVYLPGSIISNSYSTGTVTGQSKVGGFVGQLYGSVSNSYSTSTVTGERNVGGLIGYAEHGVVRNSYAAGVVVGNERVGGLVGYSGTITSSYYDTEVSGQGDTRGTGKSTVEMKRETTFITWDFELIWGLDSDINNGYPHLQEMQY